MTNAQAPTEEPAGGPELEATAGSTGQPRCRHCGRFVRAANGKAAKYCYACGHFRLGRWQEPSTPEGERVQVLRMLERMQRDLAGLAERYPYRPVERATLAQFQALSDMLRRNARRPDLLAALLLPDPKDLNYADLFLTLGQMTCSLELETGVAILAESE